MTRSFSPAKSNTKYVEAHLLKQFMQAGKPQDVKLPGWCRLATMDTRRRRRKSAPATLKLRFEQRVFKVAVTEVASAQGGTGETSFTAHATDRFRRRYARAGSASFATKTGGGTATASKTALAGEVRSAMNGVVKELLVKVGDAVEKGQKVLILRGDEDGIGSRMRSRRGESMPCT